MAMRKCGLMLAAVCLLLGSVAQAQRPGRVGPGGGPFGPGRFGMMRALPDHDPLVSHVMELLARPDVQVGIHLDMKQRAALDEFQGQAQQAVAQQMAQFFQEMRQNRSQGIPPDRNTFFQQIQEQRTAAQAKAAGNLPQILHPEQMARLHELDLQWRGVLALGDAKVAEEAHIGAEHRSAIQKLAEEYRAKSRELRMQFFQNMRNAWRNGANQPPSQVVNGPTTLAALDRADLAARKEYEAKALAILSAEEKARWMKIQGEPFTFRADFQG
ncbi:MAG: hypothetical protein ACP5VE_14135 [Chthonomonadales bacterium]